MSLSKPSFSFCESVHAVTDGHWHIRKLSDKGQKFGGGIDTPFLCGRSTQGWDLHVEMTEYHLKNNTCKSCLEQYRKQSAESGMKS